MKTSLLGCCALLLGAGACGHVPPVPSVVWNGEVPPLCPVADPHIGPVTMPGVYVLQMVNDSRSKDTFAFLIFVAHGSATVQNLVGPIVTDDDMTKFYNALGVLGSARPGGFWCDHITEEKPGTMEGFNPREGPRYGARNRCPGNPHALLAVPSGERLASGPLSPSPPPPDVTGFVQVVDTTDLSALGATPDPRGMLASLHPFVGDPGGCQKLDPKDRRLKGLGTYVQRALDAVNLLSPGVIK